jgi:hypothetical protein
MTRYLTALGILVVVAAAWVMLMPAVALDQPLNFNHLAHAEMIDCDGCHEGVRTSERAGIPQGDLCLNCHEEPPSVATAAQWEEIAGGSPIAWQRVTRVPEHAYFSHRRHVTLAQLGCETCHGDIGTRSEAVGRAPINLDMDTCISCHAREGASEDCVACHR